MAGVPARNSPTAPKKPDPSQPPPPPPKGWGDVAIVAINALWALLSKLIDKGQLVGMLVLVLLLGAIGVVITLAIRLPESEIATAFGSISFGFWQASTLGMSIAFAISVTTGRVRQRAMQAEIDRMAEEKKELQARLIPGRLDTSSSMLSLKAARDEEGNEK
jgi:hypothetical protein